MAAQALLTNKTDDTAGFEINVPGGKGLVVVWGTFGGATINLQIRHNDAEEEWVNIRDNVGSDVAITAPVNDEFIQYLPSDFRLRAIVSGSTGTTDLNAKYLG